MPEQDSKDKPKTFLKAPPSTQFQRQLLAKAIKSLPKLRPNERQALKTLEGRSET